MLLGILIVAIFDYKYKTILDHLYDYIKESKKYSSSLSIHGPISFKIARDNEPELIGKMKLFIVLSFTGMPIGFLGFILLALTYYKK